MKGQRKRAWVEAPLLLSITLFSVSGTILTVLGTFLGNLFFYGLGCVVAAVMLFFAYLICSRVQVERMDGSLEAIEEKVDALAMGDFSEAEFSKSPKQTRRILAKLNKLPFREFPFPMPHDLKDEREFFSFLKSALLSLRNGLCLVGFYRFEKDENLDGIRDEIVGFHRKTAFIFVSGISCKAETERIFEGLKGRLVAAYHPDFELDQIRDILLEDDGEERGLFIHSKEPKSFDEKVVDFFFEFAPLQCGVIHIKEEEGKLMKEWVGGERINVLEGLSFETKKVSRFLRIAKRERLASLSDFSLLDPILENELSEIGSTSICFELFEIEKGESVLAYLVWNEGRKKEVTPHEKDLLSDLIEFALKRLLGERFLIPSTGGSSFRLESIRDPLPRL